MHWIHLHSEAVPWVQPSHWGGWYQTWLEGCGGHAACQCHWGKYSRTSLTEVFHHHPCLRLQHKRAKQKCRLTWNPAKWIFKLKKLDWDVKDLMWKSSALLEAPLTLGPRGKLPQLPPLSALDTAATPGSHSWEYSVLWHGSNSRDSRNLLDVVLHL